MIPILAVVGIVTVGAAAPAEFYQSRYDHVDVESILNNRRMVKYYAACLLSQGPCPPQGTELKKLLPEALETNCARCTDKQKTAAYHVIKRLKKGYPKIWDQLQVAWDSDNKYVSRFERTFEGQNSVVPQAPQLFNRFGESEDPVSPTSVTSPPSSSTTTIIITSTTTQTAKSTKPTNPPATNKPIYAAKPTQAPQFTPVGPILQPTVTFMAALRSIVVQLYQHKLETLSKILSGRQNY